MRTFETIKLKCMSNATAVTDNLGINFGFCTAPHIENYLTDILRSDSEKENVIASLVIFGSAAVGGYARQISDVDLLLVIRDGSTEKTRSNIQNLVSELEKRHGIAKPQDYSRSTLERLVARLTANVRSFFVCTHADLLSGDPGRILGISEAQAKFVDRTAVASIITSGITVYGENLLAQVPLSPIRRLDVGKAFFGLFNQLLLIIAFYPVLSMGTKYAMDTLKRSVHNCYFCYHLRLRLLTEEVAFFQKRYGVSIPLTQLLSLRSEYHPSIRFVISCIPAMMQLHLHTIRDNRFPRYIPVDIK
jgi:predicted nucleotidyltransferase